MPLRQQQQVGTPDPELNTSPILDEAGAAGDEDMDVLPDGGSGICYFNNVAYHAGDFVVSGNEVLKCERPGVWVRQGEADDYGVERS